MRTHIYISICVNAAKESDEWEHEVDIVPPIVGKDAVLGCNGLGEACPVGFVRILFVPILRKDLTFALPLFRKMICVVTMLLVSPCC